MKVPLNITENRAELLRLFFTNPDRSFYMQEIGRILGKKPGVFQRTINAMETEGLLVSEYKANARFFRINKEYPLYDEVKSIVFKTVGIAGSLKDIIAGAGRVDFAFIYGSFAKGKEHGLSDVDLVVVGNPDEDRMIAEFDRLEEKLKREINYKLYSPKTFGRDIAAKDPFLLEILKDKKVMLMGEENELPKVSHG